MHSNNFFVVFGLNLEVSFQPCSIRRSFYTHLRFSTHTRREFIDRFLSFWLTLFLICIFWWAFEHYLTSAKDWFGQQLCVKDPMRSQSFWVSVLTFMWFYFFWLDHFVWNKVLSKNQTPGYLFFVSSIIHQSFKKLYMLKMTSWPFLLFGSQ